MRAGDVNRTENWIRMQPGFTGPVWRSPQAAGRHSTELRISILGYSPCLNMAERLIVLQTGIASAGARLAVLHLAFLVAAVWLKYVVGRIKPGGARLALAAPILMCSVAGPWMFDGTEEVLPRLSTLFIFSWLCTFKVHRPGRRRKTDTSVRAGSGGSAAWLPRLCRLLPCCAPCSGPLTLPTSVRPLTPCHPSFPTSLRPSHL